MKQKNSSRLWLYFVFIIFGIMLLSTVIIIGIAYLFLRLGYFHNAVNPLMPVIFLLSFSIMIGTGISFVVARKILKPIMRFSIGVDEVAKGNFNVRIDESGSLEEIRAITRKFNLMAEELSGIETLRNDFVVNVSHEFKTPLAAIEGYATLLQDLTLSEAERTEYIRMILDGSRQLAALSHNILSLSKLENQELLLEKEIFRLDEQIRSAILSLEPEWSIKNLELQIDLDKTNYFGNEALLMQVWLNLLSNAIKFTPHGGEISVKLLENENNIVIEISDTGCGMEENVIRHIFDKFYQADNARKASGNGLGLPLVKRILHLSSGDIEVISIPDEGSTFTITLSKSQA